MNRSDPRFTISAWERITRAAAQGRSPCRARARRKDRRPAAPLCPPPSGASVPSPFRPPPPSPLAPAGAHLLHRQLLQLGEGAGEQADQEGGRAADDVDHGGREHGDEGVLPGEGVQQGHHRVGAAGQGAGGRTGQPLRVRAPGPGPDPAAGGAPPSPLRRCSETAGLPSTALPGNSPKAPKRQAEPGRVQCSSRGHLISPAPDTGPPLRAGLSPTLTSAALPCLFLL